MMMVVMVVVVTLMLTAVLVAVVGKSDSPRHWVSQVRGRGIERDQEGSRSENCHLLFIVDYPFLVMYYLSDKKGAGLQIETLSLCTEYKLSVSILSLFLFLSYLCLGLCFIWLCTSCRKQLQRKCASEQLSQNVAETQTPPPLSDCSSRSRSSKFEICGSSTPLQALLLQHHSSLKIFTLITKHRQEGKSSLQ